jgi:DNA repair exonuclease SbcCD ATPase subunit
VAETVVINIEANTQGLQTTIDLLTKLGVVEQKVADEFKKTNEQNVQSLNKGVQQTTKEFEKLDKAVKGIKGDNQLAKSLDASKEIAKTGNSFQSLRQQFKEATAEVQRLAEQYGELDARTIAAAQKAGQLKDQIGDINAQINALSPEGKFQAIQNLAGAIGGVFQVATGALQAFGVESEQATKIAQQFQGALNIFGGLSQLSQLKDSLTAVKAALGLTTAAQTAQTAAQVTNTSVTETQIVATEGATVAQNALNKSILTNPYVAVGAALIAFIGLLVAFGDEQENINNKLEDTKTLLDFNNQEYEKTSKLLDRDTKARLSAVDTEIQLAKTQQLGAEKIGELERQRVAILIEGNKKIIEAKDKELAKDKEIFDANANQVGESFVRAAAAANERIKLAEEERKDLVLESTLLNNQLKVVNAQATADLKAENEKRAKDRADAIKANFDQQLQQSTEYYQKLRNLAKLQSDSEDEFKSLTTLITAEELRKQLALYEKFGKDTTGILVKIKENAEAGAIVKVPAIDPIKNAVEDINTEFDKIKPKEIKITGEGGADLEKDIQAKADTLKEELGKLALATGLEIAFQQLDQFFQDSIDRITELKDAQLEAITEEEEALNESYENRKIGKRELELEQERLTKQRIAAEKKAEKEIIEIKKKQDLANRAAALFNIGINTAVAVTKTTAELGAILAAPLIPLIIAQGALQAAAVLAQPLPKYKKGTLSVGGVGSDDSQLALLQPGEAVIPTETNKRYHPAIKAIYHGKIKADDINNFVNLKLRGDYSSSEARPVMAKMDTSDLYALGRIMKKNDGVYVKNIGELAAMIADSYNPRR